MSTAVAALGVASSDEVAAIVDLARDRDAVRSGMTGLEVERILEVVATVCVDVHVVRADVELGVPTTVVVALALHDHHQPRRVKAAVLGQLEGPIYCPRPCSGAVAADELHLTVRRRGSRGGQHERQTHYDYGPQQ